MRALRALRRRRKGPALWVPPIAVSSLVAVLGLAACGASTTSSSSSTTTSQAGSSTTAASASSLVVSSSDVMGYGKVLADSKGNTFYVLSSEKGGKITCTDANGCTKIWPDTPLPTGVKAATAGNGVNASLLGTVKGADGELYVTYNGWPLYTYSGDNGPDQSHGEGISSFGGTWSVLSVNGDPVMHEMTSTSSGQSTTTSTAAPYSGGY